MKEKLLELWAKYEEDFDLACVLTAIFTAVYVVFYTLNWLAVRVLDFTGLKYLLFLWVGIAVGRVIKVFLDDKSRRKAEETEDDDTETGV